MEIRILAFARVRELLETGERELELPEGACVRDAWDLLAQRYPSLDELRSSTRIARNGAFVNFDDPLDDRDELALLPPVGGG